LPLPREIPAMQRLAGAGTHWALYALLLTQPVIGWIATSAYPAPIPVFGLFELPPLWGANRALSDRLFSLHAGCGIAIAGKWCCMWQPRAITISSARTACSCACSRADRKYRDISYLDRNYNQ
jgi:hypothetical protein